MEKIKDFARKNFIPIVRDETAKYLEKCCHDLMPDKILEIGTAIGYSGILMLRACNGKLWTIEKDVERFNRACENFKFYNLENRVQVFNDDALNVLNKLAENDEKFEFIFLDGAKGQYIKYYPIIKNLLKKGGLLFADNVLMGGLVENFSKVTHKKRAMVRHMIEFNNLVMNDKDFVSELIKIDDGFIIAKKIK